MNKKNLLIAAVVLVLSACDNTSSATDPCATNSAGGVLCRFDAPNSDHRIVVYWFPDGGAYATARDPSGRIVELSDSSKTDSTGVSSGDAAMNEQGTGEEG